jgi:hypothetical protein
MLVWSGHCPEIHPPLRDHREWYRRREDARQMTCHIGAKNMPVTFKIMTEGVRPQFVELFSRGMTAGVGPVGISATPMK